MTLPAPVPQADKDKAAQIGAAAEEAYNSVRNRGELKPVAIRALLAKVFLAANNKMRALESASKDNSARILREATATAWGIDDIAGTNPVDRAAASMSFRDAVDRAAKLNDDIELGTALAQAESNGDELAARAVAQRAFNMNSADVLNTYLSTRPRAEAAVEALVLARGQKSQAGDWFAFMLPKPAELTGLADYEIAAIAATAPAIAVPASLG